MDQAPKPWVEGCKVKKPRSSGGDLILAINLQGVGVAPQLYNEGLTPSFDNFSHAIVMLLKSLPILLSYSLKHLAQATCYCCIESCPSWAVIEEFFGGTLCYILHSS